MLYTNIYVSLQRFYATNDTLKYYYFMKNIFKLFALSLIGFMAIACSNEEVPSNPNSLRAPEFNCNVTENVITVTWSAIEGAAYYQVALNDNEPEKTDKLIHRFEGLKWDTTYTIKLQAISTNPEHNSAIVSKEATIAARVVPAYREWYPENGAAATAISDNGRWVVGCLDRQGMIIDLNSDEIVLVENFDCMDVADNGIIVGATYEDSQSGEAAMYINGESVKLDLSELTESNMSSLMAVTPDGEYMVGWWWEYDESSYYGSMYGMIVPFAYDVIKDRITVLPVGENLYPLSGVSTYGVSPERAIVGCEQSNAMMAVYWEDEYTPFTYPQFEYNSEYVPTATFGDTQVRMTPSGKYLYGIAKTYPEGAGDVQLPACYNVETGEVTTFAGECAMGSVSAMTDDGTVFLNNVPVGYETAYVADLNGNTEELTPIVNWLITKHSIDLYNYLNTDDNSYVIIGASADGRTLLGLGYTEMGQVSYVISLDGQPMP